MQSQMQETPPFLWSQVFCCPTEKCQEGKYSEFAMANYGILRRFTKASQSPSHARLLHWSFFKVFCWLSHIQSARLLITKKINQKKHLYIPSDWGSCSFSCHVTSYCKEWHGSHPQWGANRSPRLETSHFQVGPSYGRGLAASRPTR